MSAVFLYLAALMLVGWGTAHLFPTRSVVAGFGEISSDNRHILTMEWIIEGVSLIFLGLLVAGVTLTGGGAVAILVYWMVAGVLIVLAVISLLTGFKVEFLPFKLCPGIFTLAALLILIGSAG